MAHEFAKLKELMSKDKIVHTSLCAIERKFYNGDNQDFSANYEHEQVAFRLPFSSKYEDDIVRIVMETLPEYDMIIWRTMPEIQFFRYVVPLRVDFASHYSNRLIEAVAAEYHDHLTSNAHPDFVNFYSRFSLGKDNKQIHLKFGENHG